MSPLIVFYFIFHRAGKGISLFYLVLEVLFLKRGHKNRFFPPLNIKYSLKKTNKKKTAFSFCKKSVIYVFSWLQDKNNSASSTPPPTAPCLKLLAYIVFIVVSFYLAWDRGIRWGGRALFGLGSILSVAWQQAPGNGSGRCCQWQPLLLCKQCGPVQTRAKTACSCFKLNICMCFSPIQLRVDDRYFYLDGADWR